jgi:ABC-type multidrug transport system ATPase subunit
VRASVPRLPGRELGDDPGADGSGRTTTMRCVLGLTRPQSNALLRRRVDERVRGFSLGMGRRLGIASQVSRRPPG